MCDTDSQDLADPLKEIFVLNPVLELRPDKRRAVLFHTDPVECGKSPFTKFLSPRVAAFLSLFNGRIELRGVIRLWAEVTGQAYTDALREAIVYLEAHKGLDEELLIPADQAELRLRRLYSPTDFAVDASEIDLTSTRCYIPTSFNHEVCYRCVTRCVYCYSDLPDRTGSILPLSRLREIVEEASRLGIANVPLSGGDPFCHHRIFEVLNVYNEAGIYVDVPTKTPLEESQLQRIKEMPFVRLQFSIDGVEPEINDWLVGVQGHTARMVRALNLARELGLKFSTNTVLTAYNYKQGADLVPFLMDNFGEQVKRISLTPYARSIYHHRDEFFLTTEALHYLEERVAHYKEKYPGTVISLSGSPGEPAQDLAARKTQYENRALCSANRTSFILLPDGKVTVCEELYYHQAFIIGDLAKQSIMEMWNSEQARALSNPDQEQVNDGPCSTCHDFDPCHTIKGRCYKRALQAYGYDKPHWPDPLCPHAPPGQKC
jgi:radical SAM protein with 4Fe4S-binding SPASM domain